MRAELAGISLAMTPSEGCYIPVGHVGAGQTVPGEAASEGTGGLGLTGGGAGVGVTEAPKQLARDVVLAKLKPVLEDPAILKIGHNIKFDMHVMARARHHARAGRRHDADVLCARRRRQRPRHR